MTGTPKPPPWRPLGDTGVHFWLVQRMAKSCGLDTAEAARKGDLGAETWVDMVQQCRACQWTQGCERWLRRHETEPAAQPPAECINARIFENLSERQS